MQKISREELFDNKEFILTKLALMNIRLFEIELGSQDPSVSKGFYENILGLHTSIDQEHLKVFRSGIEGLDFNMSTHLPVRVIVTSFITDNLQMVIERLNAHGISFDGPGSSHLGMTGIEFQDPDGYLVRVNQPSDTSPSWLKV